jgi:hypothetical protein
MTTLHFPLTIRSPAPAKDLALGMRLSMSQGREIQPVDVFRVLNASKLRAVLVDAHAVNARTGEPRATVDVDVIAQRPKIAARALQRAFPHLTLEDHTAVIRFRDEMHEAIDVIKPQSSLLFKMVVDSASAQITIQGVKLLIPDDYALLALKFASMANPNRSVEDRYVDGRDFILVAKAIKPIVPKSVQQKALWKYGEAAYRGGGDDLLKLVTDARAGRKLNI